MTNITVETIRAMKAALLDSPSLILDGKLSLPYFSPKLRDGIIYFSGGCVHPKSFIDICGAEAFMELDSDIPKEQLQAFVDNHKSID